MEPELIKGFLDYLVYQKKYSKHTSDSYQNDLQQFSDFLNTQYQLSSALEVTHSMVRSWIVDSLSNGYEPRSVNRRLSALKSFYKYLMKEGLLHSNPLHKIQSPKVGKKLPVFLEEKAVE